jgi:hypothetical protein
VATAGDLTSSQALSATRNITLGASGALSVADVTAANGSIALSGRTVSAGALTASLDVTVTSNGGGLTAGPIAAGEDLTLKAVGGGVQVSGYKVGRDLTLQGATLSLGQALSGVGRDLTITTPGDFAPTADLTAGRNLSLVVGGAATLKGVSAPQVVTLDVQGKLQTAAITASDVHIIAGDLDVGGTITAQTAEIESRAGALRLGGSTADGAPASGLWLDSAEVGHIHVAKSLTLYAGPVAGAARGDLTVLNLDLDPNAAPLVNLYAGATRNVLVQGTIAPTAPGGAIFIGDPANTAWRPNSILITGAVGAVTFNEGGYSNIRDFNDVELRAGQDIIMGSQRFVGLIQATPEGAIDLGRNQPGAAEPTTGELNKVFVSAGRLELSAAGKVVNQDTSSDVSQSVGIFLTSKASPDLVIDPPKLVDIFGSFLGKKGSTVTSFAAGAGVDFTIVDPLGAPTTGPAGAVYKFNSCAVGTSLCSAASNRVGAISQNGPVSPSSIDNGPFAVGSSDPDQLALGDLGGPLADSGSSTPAGDDQAAATPTSTQTASASAAGEAAARTAPGRAPTRPLATIVPRDPNTTLNDPVTTGAGSEEIWRKGEARP